MWVGVWGEVCLIDINAYAVHAPAAHRLALHQTTGDAQCSAVHSWGAQLQVTNSARLGDDFIIHCNLVITLLVTVLFQL